MKVLAIDTSNHPMSVAVVEDDQLLATETLNMVRNHSIYLMPAIDKLFKLVKWQPEDVDRIVVAQGPGSYTGIRIAVSTAKVLADTLKKELVGISSLEVLARNVVPTTKEVIVPFFDARRGNVFAGAYQWQDGKLINRIPDQHLAIEKTIGEMPANIRLAPRPFAIPSTYQLALVGENAQPVADIDSLIPHYLRITEAEANWQKLHPGETRQNYVREV